MTSQLMKPPRSCRACQQSSSPSTHAAICSATSRTGHPTSCSAAQPAPWHLQKSAVPKGFLNSKAEFQLHIKGKMSVFKQRALHVAGSGSRELKGFLSAVCLHPPCPPVLGCSQPTQGLSWTLGSHPSPPCSPRTCRLRGPLQVSPTRQDDPAEEGQPPGKQPPTVQGLLYAQRGTANVLSAKRSNLVSGSVLAAGKRVLVWDDTISGQRPARLNCFSSCSASLLATGTTPLSREISSTCTQAVSSPTIC